VDTIPLSIPNLAGNEWRYVKECLDSGWVSSVGGFVTRLERAMAAEVGARHAVATASGTAALHVALLVAGIQPGDEVLMPSLTFIAPANAIRYVGAHPVFVDVDPEYWQLDVEKTGHFLATQCEARGSRWYNRTTGRPVTALLPVHVLGHPCDLDPLLQLAARHNLTVIEDATESLGSTYRGRKTGSIGRLGCFSFNGNKIITAGGGGMITTDDEALAARARYLTTQAKDDPVEFVHGAIGYNYRLTNLQAAVACAQLEQLPGFLAKKRAIAGRYQRGLANLPGVQLPAEAPWAASNWWLFTVRVDSGRQGRDSRALLAALAAQGIQCRPFWQPMHRSPAHQDCQAGDCATADRLWREGLSLPSSTNLAEVEQDRVIAALRRLAG
jgi:perosamine synthetase